MRIRQTVVAGVGAAVLLAGCSSARHAPPATRSRTSATTTTISQLPPAPTHRTVSARTPMAKRPARRPAGPYSGTAPDTHLGPLSGQSPCPGSPVTVAPGTSCGLAGEVLRVVQDAFVATGHLPATVMASDPATGQSYRLSCAIRGSGSELACLAAAPASGTVVVPVAVITGQPSSAGGGGFSPTPAQIAQAKQALPRCRKNQPGITLRQLEREAATSVGIQC